MYCIKCGHKISADSRFCFNCGHPTGEVTETSQPTVVATAPSSPPQVPPEPGLAESLGLTAMSTPGWMRTVVRKGWTPAGLGAGAAAVAILLLGILLAVASRLASSDGWAETTPPLTVTDVGGIFGYAIARVRIDFIGFLDTGFATYEGSASTVGAVLTLFGLSTLFITLGARYAVTASGFGEHRERLAQGTKFGVLFALIVLVGSYLFTIDEAGTKLGPDHGSAFWWSLSLGVSLGLLGALWSIRRSIGSTLADLLPPRFGEWGHAISAAWVSVRYGLVISAVVVAVFVVLTIVSDLSSAGLDEPAAVAGLVLSILLLLPDTAALVLLGSHGASYRVTWFAEGEANGPFSYNYLNFPTDDPTLGIADIAPWYVFALLLIPVIATMAGAYRAAVRAAVRSRDEARRVGLRMAIPYAVMLWLLALVAARFTFEGALLVNGFDLYNEIFFGFSLVSVLVLGGLWGVAGSWLSSARFPRETPTAGEVESTSNDLTSAETSAAEVGAERQCQNCGHTKLGNNSFCTACGSPLG